MINTRKGFTFVEFLVVICILGIVFALLLPLFASVNSDEKKSPGISADVKLLSMNEKTVIIVITKGMRDEIWSRNIDGGEWKLIPTTNLEQ